MKIAMLFILQFVLYFSFAQSKNAGLANNKSVAKPHTYFDENDPYFLEDFISELDGSKKKWFDSLIKKSPHYKTIPNDSLELFIDSFRNILLADTGKVCQSANHKISNQRALKSKSNFIVWVNKKAFYRIGYHPSNTLEFVNEFWDNDKIKEIAIVVPPNSNYCIGKTIAHIYLTTKRKVKFNYYVAGFEKKQMKIGSRWVGSNW